jgi:hypothetical protein
MAGESCGCAGEYKAVGPAFKVRGRLSNWNGNPTRRIWIIGTNRVLGIREGTELPGNLESLIVDFDSEVTGDFVLCPLTTAKPGVMQIVCVSAGFNLSKRSKAKTHPPVTSRLTPSSTRTPPALPFALSQLLAISAPLVATVQAPPVNSIR